MPTYSKAEIAAIRAKKEEDRTEDEKTALLAADAKKPDEEHMIPQSRLNEVLENNRKLQERLELLETERKTEKDEALAKQGEWKTLAEQRQARINELEKDATKATTYEGVLKKNLEAQMNALSPEMKKLVPKNLPVADQLEWLADNHATLTKAPAPNIGAGKTGGKRTKPDEEELDPILEAEAAKFGMSGKEYKHFAAAASVQPFQTGKESDTEPDE